MTPLHCTPCLSPLHCHVKPCARSHCVRPHHVQLLSHHCLVLLCAQPGHVQTFPLPGLVTLHTQTKHAWLIPTWCIRISKLFLAGELGFESQHGFMQLAFLTVNGTTPSSCVAPVSTSLAPEGSGLLVVIETTPRYSNLPWGYIKHQCFSSILAHLVEVSGFSHSP